MKSVLLSIQPEYCALISSGTKTVEIRKTKPKIETPFKCYIYETKGKKQYYSQPLPIPYFEGKGQVIGEFICNMIVGIKCPSDYQAAYNRRQNTCVTDDEIMEYAKDKEVFYWHISDLVIYDKPKELSEFFVCCERCDKRPIACEYLYEESNESVGYYSECMCNFKRPIKRPPQSWCYVEKLEVEEDG